MLGKRWIYLSSQIMVVSVHFHSLTPFITLSILVYVWEGVWKLKTAFQCTIHDSQYFKNMKK